MHKTVDRRPVLIYCRESRDENGESYERIETQRDILLDFCRRRGLVNVVDVILDDDTSGTSFRRFDPVIERVRQGEIQVLVFKDASRLGRNLKESLIFVDLVESCGAEILFESEEYNEDFFPLKAWFNEQRAKEDGQKIRRVLRHKMEAGTLLIKPFYGYRPGEAGRLVPDEQTASVVRWIFQQAQLGRGSGEIAGALNRKGLPTPSQAAGYEHAAACWNAQHIRRILTNSVYVGTMVYNRTGRKSYKNKTTIRRPETEWIILENHHEPLVPRELFNSLQRPARRQERRTAVSRPFSGLLRCGRCGSPLVLRSRKNRPDAYICGKNHREGAVSGRDGCTPHHVRESVLYEAALKYLERLLRSSSLNPEAIADRLDSGERNRRTELEKKLGRVRNMIDQMYDDRLRGVISEELFVRKYASCVAEEETLEVQLRSVAARRPGQNQLTGIRLDDIILHLDKRILTKELARTLFDRILVYEPGELPAKAPFAMPEELQVRVQTCGGIVFVENMASSAPQSITPGWV